MIYDGVLRKLILQNDGLGEEAYRYLQAYIDQVNTYKVIGFHEKSPVFSIYQPPLATPAGMRALAMRLRRRFESARFPASATISITKACQCECDHCSAVFYNHCSDKSLSSRDLKAALAQTVELGATTLILLGGEPLLKKDLPEIIASVPAEKATVILFTNGEFLTPDVCRVLKESGLLGAFISLDSADPDEHDRLRKRTGLFERAIRGIENLRQAGVIAGISSYLSPGQLADNMFERMMTLGKRVGAQEITFFDAIPTGRWLRDTSCLLEPNHRQMIAEAVRKYRKLSEYPGLSVQSTMTSEQGSSFCFAANTQFYLTAFGDMCPCDFTPLTIGRFPDEPIADLWQRMIESAPYCERSKQCRMQNLNFRKHYLEQIPEAGPFPYPISKLS